MTIQALLLHPIILCLGAFVVLWAGLEAGRWLARRHEAGGGDISGIAVDGAVFALFGLLIASTFAAN